MVTVNQPYSIEIALSKMTLSAELWLLEELGEMILGFFFFWQMNYLPKIHFRETETTFKFNTNLLNFKGKKSFGLDPQGGLGAIDTTEGLEPPYPLTIKIKSQFLSHPLVQ